MSSSKFRNADFSACSPGSLWCRDTKRNPRLRATILLYAIPWINNPEVLKDFQMFNICNDTPIMYLGISKKMKTSSYFNSTQRMCYKVIATTVDKKCIVGWIADKSTEKLTPYKGTE